MSNETSNSSVGKAGMEVGLSTAKFFQHLFERDGSSSLEGAFERDDNPSKGSEANQISKGRIILRKLPRPVQKEIQRVVEASTEQLEKLDSKSPLRRPASFHFRKGFAIGSNMAESTEITLGELSQIFEEIMNAQPNNEYLQGLYKGALHHERKAELRKLASRSNRENDRGR